jgi:hypothetical protein
MAQIPTSLPGHFTRLYATISQEGDLFMVTVRLMHHRGRSKGLWGEELADSVETAGSMIAALAEQHSIPEKCIAIKIRMSSFKDGTLH